MKGFLSNAIQNGLIPYLMPPPSTVAANEEDGWSVLGVKSGLDEQHKIKKE